MKNIAHRVTNKESKMSRHLNVKKTASPAIILLVFLTAILSVADIASAALVCNSCHGNPPTDGTRTSGTGTSSFSGNHAQHVFGALNSSAPLNVCATCHGSAATTYTSAHSAYTSASRVAPRILMSANINTSPVTATFSKGVFFNQTSIPATGSCSSVNCHFQTTTPAWGSAQFTYTNPTTNDCAKCHGNGTTLAAPQDGSHPGTGKHGTYYGTDTGSCAKCHPAYTTFSHSTSARTGGRNLSLQGTDLAPANYSLPANLAYPLSITNAAASRNGTCTNLYCHSDGTKAVAAFTATAAPTWGVNTLTCASCHGGAVGSTSQITTNSHNVHVNGVALGRTNVNITCDKCHNTTTANGTTILTTANHANKIIDVKMASGTYSTDGHAPAGTLGTCATTTCHNPGKTGVIPAATTVTWGTNTNPNKCAICHGTTNSVGSPDYASAGGGVANANSHATHALTKSISCAVCHNLTTNNGTTITGTTHLDGNSQNVNFGTFNGQAQGSAAYTGTLGVKTCASTYCHGTGPSAAWGTGGSLACNSCHGDSATPGALTGKHSVHMGANIPFYRGTGSSIGCVECHSSVVSSNVAISTQANHANGIKNYSGAKAYKSQYTVGADNTCTTYCHSNGKGTNASPGGWLTGAAINDCKGCHGKTGTSQFGEPDYISVGVGQTTSNSHPKHVTAATVCNYCHRLTAGAAAGTIVTGTVDHIDGNVDARLTKVNSFTTYSGAYNAAVGTKTCSATYCHGGLNTTPSWGAASLVCNQCHDASNGAGSWATKSAHNVHYASATLPSKYSNFSGNVSTATTYRFTCSSCHAPGSGKATHANGSVETNRAAEVFYGFTTAGKNPTYTSGGALANNDNGFNYTSGNSSCSATYCHSDGNGGTPKKTAFTWASPSNTLRCYGCHGAQDIKSGASQASMTGYSSIRTNAHARHVRPDINTELGYGNGLDCSRCHGATVSAAMNSYSTVSSGVLKKNRHINKLRDYSGAAANPNTGGSAVSSGQFNATSHACSNVYCHSNSKLGISNGIGNIGYYKSPDAWNSGTANKKCNYCHGNNDATTQWDTDATFKLYSSTGAPNYVGGAAGSTSANSHRKHVTSVGTTDYSNTQVCYNCHSATLDITTGRSASAAKFRAYSSRHTNGSYNIKMTAVNAGSYVTGTKTCNNVNCHGGAGTTAQWGATLNCQDCHGNGATATVPSYTANFWKDGTLTAKIQMTGVGSWSGNGHGATVAYGSGNPAANFGTTGNACEFCHDPAVGHKSDSNVFRLKNYSTAAFGRNAPCLICHSATGGGVTSPSVKNRTTSAAVEADHFGAKHGVANSGGQFCWDCHNPHGTSSANWYMIRNNPAKVSDRATGAPTTQTATVAVLTAKATGTDFANGTTFNGVCNVCHTTTSHYTATSGDGHNSTTACVTCHSHTGSAHGSDAFTPAGGGCNGCHDYEVTGSSYTGGVWSGGSWGKAGTNFGQYPTPEGWGAHAQHINHIKTRLGIAVALDPASQTFGAGVPSQICGTCHTNTLADHNTGGTTTDPSGRKINFGNSSYKLGGPTGTFSIIFGGSNPAYAPTAAIPGQSGTSSATAPKTCSNLSCHYFTSPLWSTY